MTGSMAAWAKQILAVTLVVAAFLVAPIADAATCKFEPPLLEAFVAHDQGEGDRSGIDGCQGFCAHGHCRQIGVGCPDAFAGLSIPPHARPVHILLSIERRASISPDGLERPPRG